MQKGSDDAIQVTDFSYSYLTVDGYVKALERVTLSIREGEVHGIIGPVGAGKTTLCRSLTGLIPHFYTGHKHGSVKIRGKESSSYSIAELASTAGFVFQSAETQIIRMTLGDEVAFGPENLGVDEVEVGRRVAESLELVGLGGLETRPTFALSGGQKQRLAIASILSMNPSIFVLDEPTSELDPQGTVEVYDVLLKLKDLGKTVVLVEQKAEFIAKVADRIVVMGEGKVVDQGTPRQVFSKRPDELLERGIRVPEVSQLAAMFPDGREFPISVEEGVSYFAKLIDRRESGEHPS
jgi:energy-coupling factor transporter ATP-binding protein EcfA2